MKLELQNPNYDYVENKRAYYRSAGPLILRRKEEVKKEVDPWAIATVILCAGAVVVFAMKVAALSTLFADKV